MNIPRSWYGYVDGITPVIVAPGFSEAQRKVAEQLASEMSGSVVESGPNNPWSLVRPGEGLTRQTTLDILGRHATSVEFVETISGALLSRFAGNLAVNHLTQRVA